VNIRGWHVLWFFLRCLLVIEAVNKYRHQTSGKKNSANRSSGSYLWMGRVIIVQVLLFGSLLASSWHVNPRDVRYSLFVAASSYLVVYIYGLMTLTLFAATMRAIAEHQVATDQPAWSGHAALRNFSCGFLSRLLLGAYGFAEHATHHLEPSIPYYRLPKLMDRVATANPGLAPTRTYVSTLLMLIRQPQRPAQRERSSPISLPADKSS
jgi:fatty acid desaturase